MKTDEPTAVDMQLMRQAASAYLARDVLPRYEIIKSHSMDFSRDLWTLIKEIEQLAARMPDEVVAQVALAGVGEARRRLTLIERAGLMGEHERVSKLARSVRALCDHYEALTGVEMCLACDQKIEPTDDSLPYGQTSVSGAAVAAGRIHARCAHRGRPRR